ncbi:hypothetical protein EI94DRAFT_1810325 [Lactarius quietus]|nr:hypothetical protein EI94DRAFT_1810325 [Lactarius quietus]
MACVPPQMILSRLRQFFNIIPINQMGITVVDLGDMDEGIEAPRSSSLPPTSVKLFKDVLRVSRHKSLPHTIEGIWPNSPSSSEESGENPGDIGDTGSSPGNASDGASSQGILAKDSEDSLRSSQGEMIPQSLAGIKKEKIKTCWFMVCNKKAIAKLPILHTSVQLELGDIFINQIYSKEHSAQVLQVWLLVMESRKKRKWKQVQDFCSGSVMLNLTLE